MDRDISPFAHREDIQSVARLVQSNTLMGARVLFRPVKGLTRDRLQRIVNCHLARNAAMGHDVPEMNYCPLVPKDVTAQVLPMGNALAVDVRSRNPASAQDIWSRVQKIGAPQAPPASI